MIKILFICHGNICRSVMAEYMLKNKLRIRGIQDDFVVTSCATTSEEIGSDIYYAAKEMLNKYNIPYEKHSARKINLDDITDNDLIICMDKENLNDLYYYFGKMPKIRRLLGNRDVSDPWWTRDFETTYTDIDKGLDSLLQEIC